jgi:hypothetical protein
MNAATAALLGAGIGIVGNLVLTWVNRQFDEKKAQRELMIKTGWDHFSTLAEWAKTKGGNLAPFETYLFHTLKVIELASKKNLSNEQIVEEVRKIRGLTNAIIADVHKENAAKAQEHARLAEQQEREANQAAFEQMRGFGEPIREPPPPQE